MQMPHGYLLTSHNHSQYHTPWTIFKPPTQLLITNKIKHSTKACIHFYTMNIFGRTQGTVIKLKCERMNLNKCENVKGRIYKLIKNFICYKQCFKTQNLSIGYKKSP